MIRPRVFQAGEGCTIGRRWLLEEVVNDGGRVEQGRKVCEKVEKKERKERKKKGNERKIGRERIKSQMNFKN